MMRVRKHRAPKGALRPLADQFTLNSVADQKAPSAKRCIKTRLSLTLRSKMRRVSESTDRQKVH